MLLVLVFFWLDVVVSLVVLVVVPSPLSKSVLILDVVLDVVAHSDQSVYVGSPL